MVVPGDGIRPQAVHPRHHLPPLHRHHHPHLIIVMVEDIQEIDIMTTDTLPKNIMHHLEPVIL